MEKALHTVKSEIISCWRKMVSFHSLPHQVIIPKDEPLFSLLFHRHRHFCKTKPCLPPMWRVILVFILLQVHELMEKWKCHVQSSTWMYGAVSSITMLEWFICYLFHRKLVVCFGPEVSINPSKTHSYNSLVFLLEEWSLLAWTENIARI